MTDKKGQAGLITDIQRFSAHDGPGIRTTIFFKGCNMRCLWCHNPDTLEEGLQLAYEPAKCISCRGCVKACRYGAHKMIDGRHVYDRPECRLSFECVKACYKGALSMVGNYMSVDEVFDQIVQDIEFYKSSGGGVTLSGGEAALQGAFAAELTGKCRNAGIQVALDTNMSLDWDSILPLIRLADLVLPDIKLMDESRHLKATGISNRMILENICRLDRQGIPFIIRTPVVPGFNDNAADIGAIAGFISKLENIKSYELLRYNPLGCRKAEILEIDTGSENLGEVTMYTMLKLGQAAAGYNTAVYIDGCRCG